MKNYFEYFTGEAGKIVSTANASGKRRSTIVLLLAYLYFRAQTDLVDVYDAEAFDGATTDKSTKLSALVNTSMLSDSVDIRLVAHFKRVPSRVTLNADYDKKMIETFNAHLKNGTLKDQFNYEGKIVGQPVSGKSSVPSSTIKTSLPASEKFESKRDSLMTADMLYEYILRAKLDTLALGVGPNKIAANRKAIIDKANSNDPSTIEATGKMLESYYNEAKTALSNAFK